jgi:tripartite ATP-independent transporter DctM subunit
MLAFLLIGSVIIQTKLNPNLAPVMPAQPLKVRAQGLLNTWPAVLLGTLILGLIFTGVATPVEASGLAVLIALLIGYLRPSTRKMLTWGNMKNALVNTTRFTSVIMLIVAGAAVLNKAWLYLGFATFIAQWMTSLTVPDIVVILMMYLLILILGCIMDPIAMMMMTMPVFLPIIRSLGYDPIWFGVIWGVLIAASEITPPVGYAMFTIKTVFPEYPFGTIIRGSLPFLGAILTLLAILTIFPGITLWLPSVIYGS